MAKISVTMRLDPELKKKAEKAAEANMRSFTNLVEVALKEWLDRHPTKPS